MNSNNNENKVVYLRLDDIIPNRFQPREVFDETGLEELADSIREHGVIQPIIVRQMGDKYELIAGERRSKATAMAGLTTIPAIIRNMDDKESAKVSLLENLQRKNLSAIEEARTYKRILELDNMTQDDLAKTMGKSQPLIANKLRLLSLTDEVQEALLNDQISERHARSLLNLTNGNEQIEMLQRIIMQRMTVRELDNEIKKLIASKQMTLELDEEEQKPVLIEEDVNSLLTPINDIERPTIEGNNNIEILEEKEPVISFDIPEVNKQDTIENINETFKIEEPIKESFMPTIEINEPKSNEIDNNFIEGFKYQDAINLVKNVLPEIKDKGISINMQEFDLDNKYQIIINIDKN